VISQWIKEIKTWTSSFQHIPSIYSFQSNEKGEEKNKSKIITEAFKNHGIVITSYEFLRIEARIFQRRTWDYIILDEAQKIKNNQS
jgi:SNF2 family DNA or RNA helicase